MNNQTLWAVVRNEQPACGLIFEREDGLFVFVGETMVYSRKELEARGYKFIRSVSIEEAFNWICDSGVSK